MMDDTKGSELVLRAACLSSSMALIMVFFNPLTLLSDK